MKRKQKLSKVVENSGGPHTFLTDWLTGTVNKRSLQTRLRSFVLSFRNSRLETETWLWHPEAGRKTG